MFASWKTACCHKTFGCNTNNTAFWYFLKHLFMSRPIDFTQGNIAYVIVRFSIPLIVGELLQNLYNSVDALVVGNLVDQHALAAVTVCGVIANMVVMFQ